MALTDLRYSTRSVATNVSAEVYPLLLSCQLLVAGDILATWLDSSACYQVPPLFTLHHRRAPALLTLISTLIFQLVARAVVLLFPALSFRGSSTILNHFPKFS